MAVSAVLLLGAALVPGTSGAFTASVTNSTDTAAIAAPFTCTNTFAASGLRDQAYFEYTLSEDASKATAADSSTAGNTGTYRQTAATHAVDASRPVACPGAPGGSVLLNGTDAWISTATKAAAPNTFSLVLWMKATNPTDQTKRGGFVMGFSQFQTAGDGQYDRFVYVGSDGLLRFGAYVNNQNKTMATTAAIDDGAWHQVAVTVSATSGAVLYVDGAQKKADATIAGGQSYSEGGWWRIGWRDMAGGTWPSRPTPAYFAGSLRFAAAYTTALSAEEVALQYRNGTPG